jgi:uncharacterized protein DUF3618
MRLPGSPKFPVVYNPSPPPREIQEDIARTRERLRATIEALEQELAPGRVIEKSSEALWSSLESGSGPFRHQLSAYAIPLALIATGLGWLFALRRRSCRSDVLSASGATPVGTIEADKMPSSAPCFANVVDPVGPVSPIDEKTAV